MKNLRVFGVHGRHRSRAEHRLHRFRTKGARGPQRLIRRALGQVGRSGVTRTFARTGAGSRGARKRGERRTNGCGDRINLSTARGDAGVPPIEIVSHDRSN